jgi:hypothetical protein
MGVDVPTASVVTIAQDRIGSSSWRDYSRSPANANSAPSAGVM